MFTRILSFLIALESSFFLFFFKRRNSKKDEVEGEDPYKNKLLCRFVLDGAGRKIGESVAIDNDILIIKSGNKYLGVPLKHIEEDEKTLLVKGLIDKIKAEVIGEKWRLESFCDIDHVQGEEDGI